MDDEDQKQLEAVAALMVDMLKKQGYASMGVKQGRVWLFSREWMQKLLDKQPKQDYFKILIQEREFKN
jgi:hypothetical protein